MGKDRETALSEKKKKSFCANKVDSVIVKEILSDIHSSQNRHHKKLIKYSFVLQTKMSCVYVMSFLLVCWILQALCPMLAEHAEVKVNATDDGFKLTLCPRWKKKKKKIKQTKGANMHTFDVVFFLRSTVC